LTTVYTSVLVLFIVGLAVALPTLRRLLESSSAEEITQDWLANFSAESYSPMENLLSDEDFDFLSRQPGFDLALYRKLRSERLQIFRMYLHRMIADFNRLHFVARLIVAHALEDQSEILKRLLWLKLRFSVTVLRAEFSYHLCRFGVGSLPARALVARLQDMSAQIGAISVAESA
jgi:hypothetical protein